MTSPDVLLETAAKLAEAMTPADLDSTLEAITRTAVEVLPQVQHASITLNPSEGPIETKAPTHDVVVRLDAQQHALREGPCYYAATSQPVVVSGHLGNDERFPNYGPLAADEGLLSQAGLRLFTLRRSQGALNLYSREPEAFGDFDRLAALFTSQAAMAIRYAVEVADLRQAMETRTTIGKAVGIVMERYQLPDDRAFAFLVRLSQGRNVKLRQIAEEIVAAGPGPAQRAD